jgi:predicted MFS family arabinose efflux permease
MLIVTVLWAGFFAINFNVVMMVPLLPFIGRDVELSPLASGLLLAAFPAVALPSNLALGPLTDRYGRKRFIVLGAASCGVLLLATAAAGSANAIILGRAATGLFMPMIGASVFAAIADYVQPADRARVSGYVASAAPIAFLISISMGLVIGGLLSWRIPLLILAAICTGLAVAACALPAVPPASPSPSALPQTRRPARLRLLSEAGMGRLLFGYFSWSAAMYLFLGFYPSWLVQHALAAASPQGIGTLLLLGESGGLLGALASGRLVTVFDRHFALAAMAALGLAAAVFVAPFCPGSVFAQAVVYGIFAFGRDLMLALILGGAMAIVPTSRRGSLNGMLNAVYQTGATAGGLAGAWLYAIGPDFLGNGAASATMFVASAAALGSVAMIARPEGPTVPAHRDGVDLTT